MEDDWDTVPGQLDVELPGVGTAFPGQPRGLERVLGRVERITPMGHDYRAVSERSQEREEPIRRSIVGMIPSISSMICPEMSRGSWPGDSTA